MSEQHAGRHAGLRHTPGPWTIKHAQVIGDQDVGIFAPGCRGPIAECFEEFVAKGDRRPLDAVANARLMSKAWLIPDLVRALRALTDLGYEKCFACGGGGRQVHRPDCALVRADEVLAEYDADRP